MDSRCRSELRNGSSAFPHLNLRNPSPLLSWHNTEPLRLMQLFMMSHIDYSTEIPTLDLLGSKSNRSMHAEVVEADKEEDEEEEEEEDAGSSEFVELSPDIQLPSGWDKVLDLQSGKVHLVNRITGEEVSVDSGSSPSKFDFKMSCTPTPPLTPLTRDFLGSKSCKSSMTEASGDVLSDAEFISVSERTKPAVLQQPWHMQWGGVDERRNADVGNIDSELELKLDLTAHTALKASAGAVENRNNNQELSACTIEKVEMALRRSKKLMGKKLSINDCSPHSDRSSQTLSNSGCGSSSSSTIALGSIHSSPLERESVETHRNFSGSDIGDEDFMVRGCNRCLMYVMMSKSNPRCPGCGALSSSVDANDPTMAFKRQRLEHQQRERGRCYKS